MSEPIIVENPTKPKKIKAETKTEIEFENLKKTESVSRKEQILDYLRMYGRTEFVTMNEFLKALYGDQFEVCKTILRQLMSEHKIEIKADLFRLGATWGEHIKKYGEWKDVIVEGDFINVPIFGRLSEEI